MKSRSEARAVDVDARPRDMDWRTREKNMSAAHWNYPSKLHMRREPLKETGASYCRISNNVQGPKKTAVSRALAMG